MPEEKIVIPLNESAYTEGNDAPYIQAPPKPLFSPDPTSEDQAAEIQAHAEQQKAEKLDAALRLRLLDEEFARSVQMLGDKILVRIIEEQEQVSQGGLILAGMENTQTERGVLLGLGKVSERNVFAAPILAQMCKTADVDYDANSEYYAEVVLLKNRAESVSYRYKGQLYEICSCVYALFIQEKSQVPACELFDSSSEESESNLLFDME